MEQANKRRYLYFLIKILISGVALFVVLKKAGVQEVLFYLTSIKLSYFLFSSLLYIISVYISAIRWKILLDEDYSVNTLFSLYFIGSFFSIFLPGVIGGDAMKIYYLYKDTKKSGTSVGSVFMDRYIGFFALLIIGVTSNILAFGELRSLGIHWVIPVLLIAFILTSFFLFGIRLGKRFSAIANFYDYFHSYIRKRKVMVKTFLLSILLQIIGIISIYVISVGLGQSLPLTTLFVFVPIIVTIITIPISISGFGVREGAFVVLFGLVGIQPQVAISISFLWFLSVALASLIGLVEYIRYKGKTS